MKDSMFDFYFFKTSLSTNNEVKKNLSKFKEKKNIALFSLKQIKGRGRINRKWISKKGDLTCSYLINKDFKINEIGKINIWFSIVLLSLLKRKFPKKKFKIKWPNDIYLNNKKLAGVLIETNIVKNKIKSLIIGLGVNFVSSPKNLDYKTISVSSFSKDVNPINFFIQLTKEINDSMLNLKRKIMYNTDQNFIKILKILVNLLTSKKTEKQLRVFFLVLEIMVNCF